MRDTYIFSCPSYCLLLFLCCVCFFFILRLKVSFRNKTFWLNSSVGIFRRKVELWKLTIWIPKSLILSQSAKMVLFIPVHSNKHCYRFKNNKAICVSHKEKGFQCQLFFNVFLTHNASEMLSRVLKTMLMAHK